MTKRAKRRPEGPDRGFEDKRRWVPCDAINKRHQPCHVHREHKRAWGRWYGRIG